MPSEFKNLTDEVSGGAQGVGKALAGMIKGADKADTSHLKLSKTQENALEITKKFQSATDALAASMKGLEGAAAGASKVVAGIEFSGVAKEAAGLADGLRDVGKGAEEAGKGSESASKGVKKLATTYEKELSKALKECKNQLKVLDIDDPKYLKIQVDLMYVKDLQDLVATLGDVEKAELDLLVSEGKLTEAADKVGKMFPQLAAKAGEYEKAAKRLIDQAKKKEFSKSLEDDLENARKQFSYLKRDLDSSSNLKEAIEWDVQIKGMEEFKKYREEVKASTGVEVKFKEAGEDAADALERWGKKDEKKFGKSLKKVRKEAEKMVTALAKSNIGKALDKQIDQARQKIEVLEHQLQDTTAPQIVTLEFQISNKEAIQSWISLQDEATQEALNLEAAQTSAEKVLERLTGTYDDAGVAVGAMGNQVKITKDQLDLLAAKMGRAQKATEAEINSTKRLREEVAKATKVTDLMANSMLDGRKEAEDFAKGLGMNATGMVAMGVAAVYFSQKLAGVLDEFEDSAVSLAQFNINTAMMNKTLAVGGVSLDSMRKSLKLTREQATEYFKVVKDGVNVIGMSPKRIMELSKALKDTFGGDPTSRLAAYIDLLKEMPTIDTDLKVTASFDRQSAALFALAEKGKMETVIEMQAVGAFGGEKMDIGKGKDKDLLNAQQETKGTMQGVHDTMLDFYPEWGPQFSAIAKTGTQILGLIGGVLAAVGAYKLFFGTQARTMQSIDRNVAAIAAKTGTGGGPAGGGGGFGGKTAGIAMIVGASLEVISAGAGMLADKFEETGNSTARYGAKLGMSFAKVGARTAEGAAAGAIFAASLVTLGVVTAPLIPIAGAIGAVAGGVIGGLIGIWEESDNLKDAFSGLGRALKGWWREIGMTSEMDRVNRDIGEFADSIGSATPEVRESAISAFASLRMLEQPSRDLKKAQDEQQKSHFASALAMQQIGGRFEKVMKSDIFAMVDFKKRLSSLKLETLGEAGGGGGSAFMNAAGEASKALAGKLKMMREEVEKARGEVARNAQLTGIERKMQLMKLHEKELEATKEFVEGVGKVVEALYRSTDIITAGLQAQISKQKIAVPMEVGAARSEDIWKNIEEQGKATADKLAATLKARGEAEKTVHEASIKMADEEKKRIDRLKEDAKTIPGLLEKLMKSGAIKQVKGAKGETDYVTDKSGIAEAAKAARKEEDEATQGLKELTDAISNVTPYGAALTLGSYTDEIKKNEIRVKAATSILKGAEGGPEEETKKFKEALKAAQDDLTASSKGYADELDTVTTAVNKSLQESGAGFKFDPKIHGDMMAAAGKAFMAGNKLDPKDLEKFMPTGADPAAVKTLQSQFQVIITQMEREMAKSAKLTGKLPEATNRVTKAVDVSEITGGLEQTTSMGITALKAQAEAEKQVNDALREVNEVISQVAQTMNSDQINAVKAQVDAAQTVAATAGLTGDPTQAVVDSMMAQADLFQQQMEAAAKGIKYLDDNLKLSQIAVEKSRAILKEKKASYDAAKSEVDAMQADIDAGKGVNAARKKAADDRMAAAESEKNSAEQVNKTNESAMGKQRTERSNLLKVQKDLAEQFPKIGEQITKSIEAFRNSISGQEIQSQFDMSDALKELSQFGDLSGQMAHDAAKTQIAAAQKRYKFEKKVIKETMAAEQENLKKRIAAAAAKGEDTTVIKQEGEEALRAKEKAMLAKQEADYKKSVVEAAQQELQYKNEILDSSISLAEAQLDLAQTLGNHYSTVVDKQKAILGMEAEKVQNSKDSFATAAKELKMTEAEFALTKEGKLMKDKIAIAEINLQKKSIGMQRSMIEQMLGAALGQTRGSFGARRGMGTAQAMLGVDATRIKGTKTGLFSGAGPGGLKPYSQRVAEMKAAGKVGGAKKLTAEQKMAAAMDKTADSTKTTADSALTTADAVSLGTSPGSFFTHDTTSEGLLASILYVAQEIAVGIDDQIQATESISTTSKGGKKESMRDKLAKGIADIQKNIPKATAATPAAAAQAKDIADIAKDSDKEAVLDKKEYKLDREAGKQRIGLKKELKGNLGQLRKDMGKYNVVSTGTLEGLAKNVEEGGYPATVMEKMVALQGEVKDTGKFQMSTLNNLENAINEVDGTIQDSGDKQVAVSEKSAAAQQKIVESNKKMSETFDKGLKGVGFATPANVKTMEKSFSGWALKGGGKGKMMGDAGLAKGGGKGKGGLGTIIQGEGMDELDDRMKYAAKGISGLGKVTIDASKDTEKGGKGSADMLAKVKDAYDKETRPWTASRSPSPVGGGTGVQEAKPAIAGGAAAAQAESFKMTVEGEMTVKFDSDMFKNQVTSIVATVIKTPEIAKSIQGVAFGASHHA